MTEKREWRRSEARRLKSRPCQKCGGTEWPRVANATGMYEDELDPVVVVSYQCANELCNNGPGF